MSLKNQNLVSTRPPFLELSSLEISVLRVVIYFDLFHHPLSAAELRSFNQFKVTQTEVDGAIQRLLKINIIKRKGDFFGLDPIERNVEERKVKSNLAKSSAGRIRKFSQLVAAFPFVRAVFLTGSYSKGVMSTDSDLDFFIVVDKGKLWITKFLMVVFRKLFLLDSHKNFCINYMVDVDHLQISDRNQFSATELITMIPVFGMDLYQEMLAKNNWVYNYYAGYLTPAPQIEVRFKVYSSIKKFAEQLLDNKLASSLGDWFMKMSLQNYRKKYSKDFSEEDFNRAIIVRPEISKVHPLYFQKKVLSAFERKFSEVCSIHAIKV